MPFHAIGAAVSARQNHISSFRKHLKSTALTAMSLAAACSGAAAQQAGKYFNADGTKTDDLEAAAATWRTPEFLKDHALADVKAEYAYAYGFTGKTMKIGMVDSGVFAGHPQLQGQFTSLIVEGTYGLDGEQLDGSGKTWKKGDKFKVFGDYDPFFNDSHGTSAAGEMIAKRDATGNSATDRMHGIAFDAHLYSANSGGTDNTVYGPNVDYEYFKEAYAVLSRNGARVVNSSWGQESPTAGDYGTLRGTIKLYNRFSGKKTFLDAAAEVSQQYGTIQVWANGNEGRDNPRAVSSLPYFRPEIEKYWIGVTGVTEKKESIYDRCGLTKYWCMAGPTLDISTTSLSQNGGDDDRDHGGHTPEELAKEPLKPAYRSTYSGTSAAAPNVTASLALVMLRYPYMTSTQARDVLFTTAQHLTDGRVKGDDPNAPNIVFGWGMPDLKKAMNGPGQFLGRFNAELPVGTSDVWSNDITDKALLQRKVEEQAEIVAWTTRKSAIGLDNGIPADYDAIVVPGIVSGLPAAKELFKALMAAGLDSTSSKEFTRLRAAVENNDTAEQLLAAFEKEKDKYWVDNYYSMKFGRDEYLKQFTDDVALAKILASGIVASRQAEYVHLEARNVYLAKKLADPAGYDAGLTKSGAGTLWLTGNNSYGGDTIVNGGLLGIGKEGAISSAAIVNHSGTLRVDGKAAGVTVNDGGVLGGNGTIGSLAANGGGTVAPGNSIGTLTVAGDATFGKGSNFDVEIAADGTSADRLAVTGKAALLGGIVSVRLEGSPALMSEQEMTALLETSHFILTADAGVSGDFEAVEPAYKYLAAVTGATSANDRTVSFVERTVEAEPQPIAPDRRGRRHQRAYRQCRIDRHRHDDGLRAAHDFALGESTILTARGMLGWTHAFGDVTPQTNLAFATGQAFSVEGLPIAEDTGIVEAGFDVGIGKKTTVGLSYVGQFSSRVNDNAVKADLTVKF